MNEELERDRIASFNAAWGVVLGSDALRRVRAKLSLHELRLILAVAMPSAWESAQVREREIACTNALARISDPAAFVMRAKAMFKLIGDARDGDNDQRSDAVDAFFEATPDEIAALAAEWTPDD